MFATHFQKVRGGTLFTTRAPHNVPQPDLQVTIAESVKAERVLCRCWIAECAIYKSCRAHYPAP